MCRRCHKGDSRASSIVAFGDHLCGSSIPFIRRVCLVTQRVKSACRAGDPGSIPGWRFPGEGNGFPGGAGGKDPACQCRRHKRRGFCPWAGKIPRRRAWQPTPVFLPGESQGQRILVGYSPWDTTEQLTFSLWEVAVECHGRGTQEQICLVPPQLNRGSHRYISSVSWAYQCDLSLSSM